MLKTKSKLTVVRGKYSDHKERIRELAMSHWDEVGMPGSENLKLDLDDIAYSHLEANNMLLGLVLLEEKEQTQTVIGYLSIVIYEHHQHVGEVFAQTDGYFVDKKHRGIKTFRAVCDMFKQAETILKEEYGVNYLYLSTNASNDLKFLADYLEFKQSAIMYLKRI